MALTGERFSIRQLHENVTHTKKHTRGGEVQVLGWDKS